jgi:hypothetical protein
MGSPHALVDAVPLGGGRWLVAGGLDTTGVASAPADVYDFASNAFTSAGSLAQARSNYVAIDLGGGRILVAGGGDGSLLTPTPLVSGEIYDAGANSWAPGPSLQVARAGTAAMVVRGLVHVIGGASANNTITKSCEWYFP